jgi:threonine synthase
VVEQASESELVEACARADRTGLFNCPHTGVALAGMEKLVARGTIGRGDRVVVISTAHGLKFVDFKVQYHEVRLAGIESRLPNPPIELPARYETVRDEMLRQIERRFR